MRTCLFVVLVGLAAVTVAVPSAQTDLDALMSRVLERRDENWKKLQQYVLEERETFQLTGPAGAPLYGFRREYSWFPREGFFIRSPRRADGVEIGDEERRRAEDLMLKREQNREKRRAERTGQPEAPADGLASGNVEDIIRQSVEPQFISSAYFLRFKFDPGHYALAGRERLLERDALRIEYYPTKLFTEGRTRPNRELRERDDRINEKMNKVAIVTLWVDPKEQQILQYDFDNIDMDFLPGRSIVRLDQLKASMRMSEPFPNVWLPASIDMRFAMTIALGTVAARYDVNYSDYRLATVTTKVR